MIPGACHVWPCEGNTDWDVRPTMPDVTPSAGEVLAPPSCHVPPCMHNMDHNILAVVRGAEGGLTKATHVPQAARHQETALALRPT